jgi:hypothetical protein
MCVPVALELVHRLMHTPRLNRQNGSWQTSGVAGFWQHGQGPGDPGSRSATSPAARAQARLPARWSSLARTAPARAG